MLSDGADQPAGLRSHTRIWVRLAAATSRPPGIAAKAPISFCPVSKLTSSRPSSTRQTRKVPPRSAETRRSPSGNSAIAETVCLCPVSVMRQGEECSGRLTQRIHGRRPPRVSRLSSAAFEGSVARGALAACWSNNSG